MACARLGEPIDSQLSWLLATYQATCPPASPHATALMPVAVHCLRCSSLSRMRCQRTQQPPSASLCVSPQGYGLIEAVLEQQGGQPEVVEGRRNPQLLGGMGRRPWDLGTNCDDSDDEAAGGSAGTFAGGGSPHSPRSPRSPGSPSARLAAASPSAAAAAAAAAVSSGAAPAAPSGAAAARLADLHAAAAGIHTAGFAEMLRRVVPVRRHSYACRQSRAASARMSCRAPLLAARDWRLAPVPDHPFFAA